MSQTRVIGITRGNIGLNGANASLRFLFESRDSTVNCYSFARLKNSRRIAWRSTVPLGVDMTLSAETALTLVVVKAVAIVGSALAVVLFLAVVGVKKG